MSNSDAAVIKALEELGFSQKPSSSSPQLEDIERMLNAYEEEFGQELDPAVLRKFLGNS